MVVFKIRDSVPSPRYSPVCNVLRQWKTSLIPTYRSRPIIICELQGCLVMNIPDTVADLMDEEHLSDAHCTRFTKVYTSSWLLV